MSPFRALTLAVVLVLTACTHGGGGPNASGGRRAWTHPGVLRMAGLSDPDTLNPLVGAFQVDVDLSMFWAGYLFNLNDENDLVPELATDVPTLRNGGISKDGLTVTYHLRPGVTWQDGAPFSADDLVFSWKAVMNPSNNVASRVGYDDIAGIDAPNPATAVVHLKRRFAPFVNSFFTMSASPFPVLPKHLLQQYPDLNRVPYNSKPVGTGPFIVQEWHRGQTLRMIANPHYWRGAPKLAEFEYRAIPDENTLTTSMRTHEIDFWYNASAATYPAASHIPDTHAILTPFNQYSYLGLNNARPFVSDVAVRRALVYATDRRRLIDLVTYGVGLRDDSDQPSFSWAYDPSLPPLPYDPGRARSTLDAAGWRTGADGIRVKNGTRLRLEIVTTTGSATGNRLAVLLQSVWRTVGIDAEIKPYASALMFASYGAGGILQTGRFDVSFASWIGGFDPDDSTLFMCDQSPPHGYNQSRFCDPSLDAAERVALTSYDRAVRARAYRAIQRILVSRVPQMTMYFARRFDVVSDDMQNYRPAHYVTTFWNTWEYAI